MPVSSDGGDVQKSAEKSSMGPCAHRGNGKQQSHRDSSAYPGCCGERYHCIHIGMNADWCYLLEVRPIGVPARSESRHQA